MRKYRGSISGVGISVNDMARMKPKSQKRVVDLPGTGGTSIGGYRAILKNHNHLLAQKRHLLSIGTMHRFGPGG
jgi:hypothetical protein